LSEGDRTPNKHSNGTDVLIHGLSPGSTTLRAPGAGEFITNQFSPGGRRTQMFCGLFDLLSPLLRSILHRVRQRTVMILNPPEIAGIKPAAALFAFEVILGLVQRRSTDTLAHASAARLRLIDRHDRCHQVILSKK
jgi:hypothetical protein